MTAEQEADGIPLEMHRTYSDMTALYADVASNMAVVLEVHAEMGQVPSCTRGCDACCHQLVLSTVAEAGVMADALDSLESSARTLVAGRMDHWLEVTEPLRHALQQADNERLDEVVDTMATQYWRQRIPCPFLVERACILYDARPLACRQHHTLGDPVHCGETDGQNVAQMEAMEDLFFLAQDAITGEEAEIGIFPELVAMLSRARQP